MGIQPAASDADIRHARDLCEAEALAARAYHRKLEGDVALMDLVAEVERYELYASSGYESTGSWLATYLGMGYRKSEEYVGIAVALQKLPRLRDTYRTGVLSYDHLRALIQVAGPDSEGDLLEACTALSVSDTFRLVDKIKAVSAEDARDTHAERWLETSWGMDRRLLLLNAQLPEEAGVKVEKAIDALARKIPDDPGEPFTPIEAKRADALCQMADAVITKHPSRATVVVHVDAEALGSGEGAAEIPDGPTVSVETARRLLCDGNLCYAIDLPDGTQIDLGRQRSILSRKKRRQIHKRDRRCRVPGCRRKKLVEVHHIHERRNGGSHDLPNLVLLCESHHWCVHEGGFIIRGSPPNIWLEHPHLPPIKVGPPLRPKPDKHAHPGPLTMCPAT